VGTGGLAATGDDRDDDRPLLAHLRRAVADAVGQ
jgi:hypothetical protein